MRILEAKKLVTLWITEEVERDSEAVTDSHAVFSAFLSCLRKREDCGDGVAPYQFDLSMLENGYEQVRDDSDWYVYRELSLKSVEIDD